MKPIIEQMCYTKQMTGEEIKKIRDSLCESQVDFGKRFSVEYHTVLRWEKGYQRPSGIYMGLLIKLKWKLDTKIPIAVPRKKYSTRNIKNKGRTLIRPILLFEQVIHG